MSPSLPDDVRRVLTSIPPGSTVIVLVGNPFRCDDGAGPYIAKKIRSNNRFRVFDAGERPEDFVEKIIALNPAAIVFLDAADFGGRCGEVRLIPEDAIPDTGISTHSFSLKLVYALLKENTGAEIHFVGIQPANVGFGEELSPGVTLACRRIISLLNGNSVVSGSDLQT